MKELSLNILDIAENSVKAGASLVEILLKETGNALTLTIRDDGCGMDEAFLARAADPFTTTRTTRPVGMGLPFLKLAAEQTGGSLRILSVEKKADPVNHGTEVTAVFYKDHIDFTPLGDMISTYTTLIQGNPDIDFLYRHETEKGSLACDTRELRAVLGEEVSLGEYEIIQWITENLKEESSEL